MMISIDDENDYLRIPDKLDCPLCSTSTLPSESEAYKCVVCKIHVYALSNCSKSRSFQDNARVCFSCWIFEEDTNRKSQRKNNS